MTGSISVNLEGNSKNLYKKYATDTTQQYLYILTDQYLKSGNKYILRITKFVGELTDTSHGFFYGFDMEDGEKV